MALTATLSTFFSSRRKRRIPAPKRRSHRSAHLSIESLEERIVPFTNASWTTQMLHDLFPGIVASAEPNHEDITDSALSFLKADVLQTIRASDVEVDLSTLAGYKPATSQFHFDNSQFTESEGIINQWYEAALLFADPTLTPSSMPPLINTPLPPSSGLLLSSPTDVVAFCFGSLLHTVQDFYSHTNWVNYTDLQTTLAENGDGEWNLIKQAPPGKIYLEGPLPSPSLTIKYAKDPVTGQETLVYVSSAEGILSGTVLTGGINETTNGISIPHDELNHDFSARPHFKQASTLAEQQTLHEFGRLCHLIFNTYGWAGVDNLINAWVKSDSSSMAGAKQVAGYNVAKVGFDAINALPFPGGVGGTTLADYLAGYGMTITNETPGTSVVVVDYLNLYQGQATIPPSLPNLLTQVGSNLPVSFTVNFAVPLDSFAFTRPELIVATPSGVTHPLWNAYAFDTNGNQLDHAGENLIASFSDVPAATFTLHGPGIASVRFDSDNQQFAAFSAVLLDDFELTTSVQPPPTPLPIPDNLPVQWQGSMTLRLNSPADMLFTDSQGRRSGVDPVTGQTLLEIPGSEFSGPRTEPETLFLPSPASGGYTVQVVGTGTGPFTLQIFGANVNGDLGTQIATGSTTPGFVNSYTLQYAWSNSATLTVHSVELPTWIHQFGTAGFDIPQAVTLDATGNVYLAGYTSGTFSGQSSSGGSDDAFVQKWDAAGNLLWTRQFGSGGDTEAYGIAVDATGIYVAGFTNRALPGQTSAGSYDAFVRAYDAAGNERWTRQFGSPGYDYAYGIAVNTSGVYVAGYTDGPLPGQTGLGGGDAFVRAYDSNGNERWTREFGTPAYDFATGIAVDGTNVYVAGYTDGTFPGQTNSGGLDAFVRVYDSAGNERWTQQFGSGGDTEANGIAANATGVYVAGFTNGAFPGQTNAGGYDAFVRAYDADGNQRWTQQFGTSANDFAYGVAVNATAVYVAGDTSGTLAGQTSAGSAFVRAYNADGNEVWTDQFGASGSDYASSITVTDSVAYVVGPTSGTFPRQTSAGGTDGFLANFALPTPDKLTAANTAVSSVEGQPFTGVVASFTDVNPTRLATDFTATIVWGDGTASNGAITANTSGGFDVTGTNSFAEEGNNAVTVTISGPAGTAAIVKSTMKVADAALAMAVSPLTATRGKTLSNVLVATFTDADPSGTSSDYTATIDWGDGDTTASVSIVPDANVAGLFDVMATKSNPYAAIGLFPSRVTITDAVASSTASGTTTVKPAAASSFVVTGFPSPVTAGAANSFTVTAMDPYGYIVTGYTGTVTFTSSAAKAVLPGNYTFTAADAGVHSFSAILRSAGTQSITATDTVTNSILGTQTGIVVNPAATYHLVVSRFPSKTTAGVTQSFRITAQDRFGNTTPGFIDSVSFSSSDAGSVLPANYTFTGADAGVHTFFATLKTAGIQSVSVQDVTNPNVLAGAQAGIVVNAAAASILQVSGYPSSVMAGTAYNFTVTALDAYDNTTPAYRGTVTFSSTDSQALLPANYAFTSGDAGGRTFFATLNSPGAQSITATDTANAGISGAESGITVVTLQPTAGISGPSVGVPGQPLVYTLSASESGLSASTVYSYSVQWGDGSPAQTLSGPSGTPASHIFTISGSYSVSVTATDPNNQASTPASTSASITTVAMETDPYNSSLTALYVGGTLGNDTIAITPVAGGGVKVGMNYVNYGSFFPTGHIVVYSQAGNDIIKAAAQMINGTLTYVNVPVLFFAGNGNDILNVTGSSANNVLVGGGGTDRLLGGQGRDILIGGAGQATLQAGSGDDILIGGTTAYDNNAAALAAILAEWGRTDIDYSTRIAQLTGSMSGGLNGSYLLNANTVHGNGLADNLYGGAGMDWYFAGIMDLLFNRVSGEVVTQV